MNARQPRGHPLPKRLASPPQPYLRGLPAVVAELPRRQRDRTVVGAPSSVPPRAVTHQNPAPTGMPPGDFSVCLVFGTDRSVVAVCGELDILTAAAFGGFLDIAASRPGQLVVVDLAEVAFLDASALRQLARILPRLRAAGSDLAIVSPSPTVYKALDLTGFTARIHVEPPTPQDKPTEICTFRKKRP